MKTRDEISAMLGGFVDAKPDEQGTLIAGVLDEFDECRNEAEQYAAQKRELKKRQKDVETKKRTHRLCQIGGAVESVLGSAIEEDDIPKLIGFLKRQEANGRFFSKAMQKEPVANTEEV